MEQHAYLGDPQREKEIHHLLDQIAVPDESLSDVSSDIIPGRSIYDPESQVFIRGNQSPGRHHEDFFENSINSTIAHTSPLSNLNMNEDSKMDSSLSQAFTPQQVSRMTDWSKNHITPAEGLFPQVSAPSMSIEGDMWDTSPRDTPQPTVIMRSHSSIDRSHNHSKKSIHNLPVLDLPTHEDKPSREVITFSPNNAEANWYFHPTQNSKRSSANQSLKFPKNSFSTELMQGSALLAHAANHHFPSEISLSQVRDNAQIFDEIHRLKTELTNLKIVFRSEQSMHEETKKELYACSCALQDSEAARRDLEEKSAEFEEKVKLLSTKLKTPESIEQLRGKSLECARNEIKQLKSFMSEKDSKIEDLKHALSQKNSLESNSARDKEIEELTYEITKLKLVNTSQSKQIKDLNERNEKDIKRKDVKTGELKNIAESSDMKLKKALGQLQEAHDIIEEKDLEIETLNKKIKELIQDVESSAKENMQFAEDLNKAKDSIEILREQLSGTYYDKRAPADYEFQLNKIRNLYEKKIEEGKEEIGQLKGKIVSQENMIKNLEIKVSQGAGKCDDSFGAEVKETIYVLQEELEKVHYAKEQTEKLCELLKMQNEELKNAENTYKVKITEVKEQEKAFKKQIDDVKNAENAFKAKVLDEKEQELVKVRNSINSINAKNQFEKDELLQKLREKDQEILELKQDLEESYKVNEEKVKMDMEYFKERLEKEKTEEIKRIKKIYNSQSATQTSFDYSVYREEIRSQLENEYSNKLKRLQSQIEDKLTSDIKAKYDQEYEAKLKNLQQREKDNYEKALEETRSDYNTKVEMLKKDYSDNASKMEEEFMSKVKSIENDFSSALRKGKNQTESVVKIESLEHSIEQKNEEISALQIKIREIEVANSQKIEEVRLLQKKNKELEEKYSDVQKMSLNKPLNTQEELDLLLKKKIESVKNANEIEKNELIASFDNEKTEILAQKDKMAQEIKKKNDEIRELKDKIAQVSKNYESRIEENERKNTEELEDYKAAYLKDIKETEKNFYLKEKNMEKEFNEKIQEMTAEFNEKMQKEQERYTDMMSKKDILSKADNQRVKEEVSSMIADKERELSEDYNKKQKLMIAQFQREMKSKELEIESLKDSIEAEKRKFRDEFTEKAQSLKQENLKNKREWEREQKKLKEQIENAKETAKKDLEITYLENLNKEKAEWDRKDKNKTKLLQIKQQKELADREQAIKNESELEKAQSLQELAETYKIKIKQIQEDQKKYYEELRITALEEKAHEVELRVRREMQEKYHRDISQLDAQHFQEKEKIREEFRLEMSKRIEEVRGSSYGDNEVSYFDMPFSNRKPKSSVGDSQDLRAQLEVYKQKLEQIEMEKENEKLSNFADYEKVRSSEYSKILQFVQEELNGFFTKTTGKKGLFPELSGIIRGFFSKLDLEIELQQEKIRQVSNLEQIRNTGEHNRKRLSQTTFNVECEDTYFIRFSDRLYISLEKTVEDLVKIHKNLAEKYKTGFIETFSCKTLKEEYFMLISMVNRGISFGNEGEGSKPLTGDEREKMRRYENELKTLTAEFKMHMLKSKEWLENNNRVKEEWAAEKIRFETKIRNLTEQVEKSQDSCPISPEMLSPEETSNLVLGIFKRSSQDSIVIQLLTQNSEFISVLHQLLENDSPKFKSNHNYSLVHYDSQPSIVSARSYTRPKSVDAEIQPSFTRPPRAALKNSSPISISHNSYWDL
ncbi:hypothetical protein SteCoe_725 [Stentor coeruleus]|uniref:Uncharacterized protein n=1 Tax=Stentor coeruleus TaxID=5963 RepID=A0A1R2D3I4_9CILI|nr:hypothetical protein SteCoe_725 [Stentor coeruleus]